jgi:hypothetical protein
MIAYSVPIYQHGSFVGVVKMDLRLDQENVKPVKRESLGEEEVDVGGGGESDQKESEAAESSALDDLAK